MRNKFDMQLDLLNEQLTHMGELCEVAINRGTEALKKGDLKQAAEVIRADEEIDQMEKDVERLCLKLLLQQQPVARDMRLVSAALKVVTDIERIGDHVADMVELYLRMGNMNSEGKQEKLLLKMMEEAKDMIHNSVEAFVEGDEANAQKVVEHDDVVDDLFNDMKKEMMQAIREQNLDADRVVDYLMMAKYLEKVGDHAVNIAQWAIFRMTGDMEGVKLY